MKIAIGQINTIIGDFSGNREKILRYAEKAAGEKADLIVFPELSICGYPPMDLLDYESFLAENIKSLRLLQAQAPGETAIAVGYVDKNRDGAGKSLRNTVSVIHEGKVAFTQDKTLLPTYDVFDEARYFEPAGQRKVFAFKGEQIGIAICEDIWWETRHTPGMRYPLDPVKDLLDAGATIILAPSASPYHWGKPGIRKELLSDIGISSGVPVIYVNMVGGNDNLIFDGGSVITSGRTSLGPGGEPVYIAPSFLEAYHLHDTESPGSSVSGSPGLGSSVPGLSPGLSPGSSPGSSQKYGELEKALILGVKDYVEKCGFRKVHLGLSGGIDSALVAVIAVKALGPGRVDGLMLPSGYSSPGSITDSEALAGTLGMQLHNIPIEPLYDASLETLSGIFEGTREDVTEENIQARIRGLLLMAYSNKFGSLLLTTGNKSELAVGYCTLYGDMCGGLSVIGDLFKTEVYELCGYINREKEIIPGAILTKPPSAELRPGQTDQDSLPPYDILDRILKRYVLDTRSAGEIIAEGYDPETVRLVMRLVGMNEYKRRQAPPVLKVSPKAFGTGRRIPIARRLHEA